jgi:hypothetical protein
MARLDGQQDIDDHLPWLVGGGDPLLQVGYFF